MRGFDMSLFSNLIHRRESALFDRAHVAACGKIDQWPAAHCLPRATTQHLGRAVSGALPSRVQTHDPVTIGRGKLKSLCVSRWDGSSMGRDYASATTVVK
jgi:hypothetical protein